jgi:hypothetical protein
MRGRLGIGTERLVGRGRHGFIVPLSDPGDHYRCPVTYSLEELQLAARNHGMPLEALRYEVTPVGLHYLLVHFDVPAAPADWRLSVDGLVERPR